MLFCRASTHFVTSTKMRFVPGHEKKNYEFVPLCERERCSLFDVLKTTESSGLSSSPPSWRRRRRECLPGSTARGRQRNQRGHVRRPYRLVQANLCFCNKTQGTCPLIIAFRKIISHSKKLALDIRSLSVTAARYFLAQIFLPCANWSASAQIILLARLRH
jgi:hypothetical protein